MKYQRSEKLKSLFHHQKRRCFHRFLYFLLAAVFFLSAAAAVGADETGAQANKPEKLSLGAFEKLALENNIDYQLALSDQRVVTEKKNIARAAMLPKLNAEVNYSYTDPAPFAEVTLPTATGTQTRRITMGENNNTSAVLQLNSVLFSGGANYRLYEAASRQLEGTEMKSMAIRRGIILKSRVLYFRALLLKESVKLAREAHERARQQLQEAQNKLNQGVLPRLEFLKFRAIESEKALVYREMRENFDNLLDQIRQHLNLDLDRNISVEGKLDVLVKDYNIDSVLKPDEYHGRIRFDNEDSILKKNPEIRAAQKMAEAARLQREAAAGLFWPEISAFGEYRYARPYNSLPEFGDTWRVGVKASWPLFTGGLLKSRYDQARQQEKSASLQLERQRRRVEMKVHTLTNRYETLREGLQLRQININNAEEARNAARVAWQNGAATSDDLNDAELKVFMARLEYYRDLTDLFSTVAEFEKLTGIDSRLFSKIKQQDKQE